MSDLFLFVTGFFLFVILISFICAVQGKGKKSVAVILIIGFSAWSVVFYSIYTGVLG